MSLFIFLMEALSAAKLFQMAMSVGSTLEEAGLFFEKPSPPETTPYEMFVGCLLVIIVVATKKQTACVVTQKGPQILALGPHGG